MAWYKAASNKAEIPGSEGAIKSLNSETFCWGWKEISLNSLLQQDMHCVDHLWPKAIWYGPRQKQWRLSLNLFSVQCDKVHGYRDHAVLTPSVLEVFFGKGSIVWGWHIKPKSFQEKDWAVRKSNENRIMLFVFGPLSAERRMSVSRDGEVASSIKNSFAYRCSKSEGIHSILLMPTKPLAVGVWPGSLSSTCK